MPTAISLNNRRLLEGAPKQMVLYARVLVNFTSFLLQITNHLLRSIADRLLI